MGKSKGPRRRAPQSDPPKPKPSPVEPKKPTILATLVAIILGVATLIGAPAAVLFFWPRMTVTVSDPSDPSNAYSVTFTASNTGFLPYEDVIIGIGICSIETAQPSWRVSPDACQDDRVPNMMFSDPSWQTKELKRDEPFQFRLTDVFNVETEKWRKSHPNTILSGQMMRPLKAANFIIDVGFKPWPLPWAKRLHYRFVAEEQPDGKVLWRAVPLSWKEIKLPPPPPPFPAPLPGK